MSHLPLPSELGRVALDTFRSSLLPKLPPEAQYEARMVLRALDFALSQTDEGAQAADPSRSSRTRRVTSAA